MISIRFENNIAQVKASIKNTQVQLLNTMQFLKSHQQKYKGHTKNMVLIDVYSYPENPKFPRSMDTLNSVDADILDKNTMRIFLNPALATRNKRFPGLISYAESMGKAEAVFKYYPAFVRRGIFFKKQLEPRDFLASWHDRLGKVFKKDVEEFVKASKK